MNAKYIYRGSVGGLGSQIGILSTLIPFAEKFDMKVVCDLRTFPYFRTRRTNQEPAAFLNDDKIDRLLEFHPRITHNSEAIDSINKKEIFNLDSWKTQHQVLQWLFNESEARGAWKRIIKHPQRTYPSGRLQSYLTQLPIRIKDRALIKKYEERIRNNVVIHARFGNGEVERFLHYWPGRKLPRTLRRLQISADKFIKEMEKYDEDFFVCTDTFSFMEKCKNTFGDRVFCTERSWAPEGIGPGHNPNQFVDNPINSVPVQITNPINQWDNFYEALAEMELLSKGKHLICNRSQFNTFARSNCENTVLPHDHKSQI